MPAWNAFSFVVRPAGNPRHVADPARAVIRALDGTVPVRNVRTLDAVLGEAVAPARWSTTLVGVLSFVVTLLAREIGIRLALGARVGSVRRMIVGRAIGLAVGGWCWGSAAP